MVGLQELALEQTEPDLKLIEPRGIDRQPIELHREFPLRRRRQFLHKARELLGGVSRAIIEDQRDLLHTTTVGLCDDNRLSKRAEIDEAFARVTLAVDQPISHAEGSHQVQCTMPMGAG